MLSVSLSIWWWIVSNDILSDVYILKHSLSDYSLVLPQKFMINPSHNPLFCWTVLDSMTTMISAARLIILVQKRFIKNWFYWNLLMRHSWYKCKWMYICLAAKIFENYSFKIFFAVGPNSRTRNTYWVSDICGVIPQHWEVNRQPPSLSLSLSHCLYLFLGIFVLRIIKCFLLLIHFFKYPGQV